MREENKRILSLLLVILILPPLQGFSSRETDFYLCQLFSNFLKYSSSNFPSSQPYSNFTIYFPSNLLLLYSSALGFLFILPLCSTFFCLLTSTLNLPLNLSTNSLAFPKSSSLFHVLFSAVNPFYYTKYLSIPRIFLLFSIFSISHSLTPSTSIGFPAFFFCPSTCFLYYTIQLMFMTGWILIEVGSHNLTALVDTTSSIA